MIVLNNYSKSGTYIVLGAESYTIVKKEEVNRERQGVGGFSEDGQILGIYVREGRFFLVYNQKRYEVKLGDLKCTNTYVSKVARRFTVAIGKQTVCDITYEPFIDPGMLVYDADPEEFDFLLYLSGILKDETSIAGFIEGMNSLKNK